MEHFPGWKLPPRAPLAHCSCLARVSSRLQLQLQEACAAPSPLELAHRASPPASLGSSFPLTVIGTVSFLSPITSRFSGPHPLPRADSLKILPSPAVVESSAHKYFSVSTQTLSSRRTEALLPRDRWCNWLNNTALEDFLAIKEKMPMKQAAHNRHLRHGSY